MFEFHGFDHGFFACACSLPLPLGFNVRSECVVEFLDEMVSSAMAIHISHISYCMLFRILFLGLIR